MLGKQIGIRKLVAGRAALHQCGFSTAYLRPFDDARMFQGVVPGRCGQFRATPFTITNLDAGFGWKFQSSRVLLRYRAALVGVAG
jgi:hypothetical protein